MRDLKLPYNYPILTKNPASSATTAMHRSIASSFSLQKFLMVPSSGALSLVFFVMMTVSQKLQISLKFEEVVFKIIKNSMSIVDGV